MTGACQLRRALTAAALVATMAACLESPPGPLSPGPDAAGAGADAAFPGRSCDEIFGSAPDYQLCSEDANSCTFYSRLFNGDDFVCQDACGTFDSECLDGFADTDLGDKCEIDTEEGCESPHEDQICVCSRLP